MILFILCLKRWQSTPKSKAVRVESVVTRDRCVICHSFYEFSLGPDAFLRFNAINFYYFFLYLAIELDLIYYIISLNFPWDSLGVSEIWNLQLLPNLFNYVLLEISIVISDPIAPGWDLKSCHGV